MKGSKYFLCIIKKHNELLASGCIGMIQEILSNEINITNRNFKNSTKIIFRFLLFYFIFEKFLEAFYILEFVWNKVPSFGSSFYSYWYGNTHWRCVNLRNMPVIIRMLISWFKLFVVLKSIISRGGSPLLTQHILVVSFWKFLLWIETGPYFSTKYSNHNYFSW